MNNIQDAKEKWVVCKIDADNVIRYICSTNSKNEAVNFVANCVLGSYFITQAFVMAPWV